MSSVSHQAWRRWLYQWLQALSVQLNIAGTLNEHPFFNNHTVICHHIRPWSVTPEVRHESHRWHDVRTRVCTAQQLSIRQLRANMCVLVWLHACIAMWVSAVSVNCYMRPLDLTFELCGLVPVRQNTGCGLLRNLCCNDLTFGGSSCAIFSLNWMSSSVCSARSCSWTSSCSKSEIIWQFNDWVPVKPFEQTV